MILYRYSKEKFCVGHLGELKRLSNSCVIIFIVFNRFKNNRYNFLISVYFDIFLLQAYKLY